MKQMDQKAGRALVAAFERSKKRIMQFCKDKGVSYAVLKYWQNRIAELDAQDLPGFVQIEAKQLPMPVTGSASDGAAAMAFLPNGARIAFQQSTAVTPAVIEALGRC